MKKVLPCGLVLILSMLICLDSMAQGESAASTHYKDAIGIRIGPSSPAIQSGITYRHFLNETNALEGLLSLSNGFGICALYEVHKPLPVENVQWFVGVGGYVSSINSSNYFGGAGLVGIDYIFPSIPLNLSIDWKPELNLAPRVFFEESGVGFSIRYTL